MSDHDPIVQTTAGRLRGRWVDATATFLGVPFAAPPVGVHWLMVPRPVAPWSGLRDALEFGPTAPQPIRPSTIIPEPLKAGDDYLNLNIFTPDIGAARLPVMVWIHGGGYFGGCNQAPWFDGKRFARDGVVVVAINYRLGFEGFMPIQGAPPNRGVLDWLAALDWVQKNVAAFGGDPSNVTIAGQSAGAAACATLLAVPSARGLFKRAILMSGSTGFGGSPASAEAFAQRFGRILGVAPTHDALAAIPLERLLAAQAAADVDVPGAAAPDTTVKWFAGGLKVQPVVDGDLLPVAPESAIRSGTSKDIPLLVSATAEEFDFLIRSEGAALDEKAVMRGLADLGLSESDAAIYRNRHSALPHTGVLGRALTDRVFRVPAARVAEARIDAPADTFLYEFRWRSRANPNDGPTEGLGACHCLDVPFAFDLLDADGVTNVAGAHPPQSLADAMHRAWADFIKTGNAGWPAWRAAQRQAMAFDAASKLVDDPTVLERTLWPTA